MDKEEIKNELFREIESMINSKSNPVKRASGLNKLNALSEQANSLDDFTAEITIKLNEILKSKDVVLGNEKERDDLMEYLKPSINILIKKYLLG